MEREGKEEFEKKNRLWRRVGVFMKRGERRVEGMLLP